MSTLVQAGAVLARTGEAAKSGPIGLAVILLLCVVCYFLFKSMSKHLRSVREGFPKDAPTSPSAAPSTPAVPVRPEVRRAAIEPVRLEKPADESRPNPD